VMMSAQFNLANVCHLMLKKRFVFRTGLSEWRSMQKIIAALQKIVSDARNCSRFCSRWATLISNSGNIKTDFHHQWCNSFRASKSSVKE